MCNFFKYMICIIAANILEFFAKISGAERSNINQEDLNIRIFYRKIDFLFKLLTSDGFIL